MSLQAIEEIENVVTNGIYTFIHDGKKGNKFRVLLTYTSKYDKEYNLNEILDLHRQALLIATTVRTNENNTINDRNVNEFIAQVKVLQEILDVLSALNQMGHFGYRKFEKNLHGLENMKVYLKSLKDESANWQIIVNNALERCYYLTFFSARQILSFYDYFTSENLDKENEEECKILIRFVNSKAQLSPREGVQKISHESNDYLEILCEIGNELERMIRNVPKHSRKLKTLGQHVKSDIVTKGKLFVAACNNTTLISNIIMSLFANHGSYPEPWQLLICTSSTTIEELTIFIKRSFFASNNEYENHLFCIANLELLDFELQYNLINQIRLMRDHEENYHLALICCSEPGMHHNVLDQFSFDVHATNGLSTDTMTEIYHDLCQNVISVSSDLSGQGKTEWIKESSCNKKKIPHSFLISDGMEYFKLVHKFKKCKLSPEESLHINIVSSDHPEDVNMFLFELLTLGIVSNNDEMASLPPSEEPIQIFIEIAFTKEQRLLNSLPMVRYLLSKHLTWNIENLRISQQINSPIQITCHYLNLYDLNEIDTKEILIPTDEEPLPVERCQNLIEKYFFYENSENVLSFRYVEIFVNVLAEQLVRLSSCQFFTIENLKFAMGNINIRSLIVGTLINVSKDFATRSIKTKALQNVSLFDTSQIGSIVQWDNSNHNILFFNSQIPNSFSMLYCDKNRVPNEIKLLLKSQAIGNPENWELDDYNTMSVNELLKKLEAMTRSSTEKLNLPEYALSSDNLIKMALILLRVRANIPVVICGEVGCGKTSLISYLAFLSEVKFLSLNLHAGVDEEAIISFMNYALDEAENGEIWLFFDEINACNHMGLFAELISRRIFNDKPIHTNIRLFSACNPYRIRTKGQNESSLTSKVKNYEEKSNLIYQVKPLPDQILDYVWDYGILKSDDECKYIQIMIDMELKKLASPVFANLLFASQKFIREVEEPYSVSLRDVKRAIKLVNFFYNSLENRPPLKKGHKYPTPGNPTITTRSYILALSLCYHSRLCAHELRKQYRQEMEQILKNHNVYEEDIFVKVTREEQEDYINRMQCPPNIAKNEALMENVLVMIVCILTKIPVFIIGETGSSKSLTIDLISSNLLDLAEKSSFNPLKVLHFLLEPTNVSVIGISNWRLDKSKSNRVLLVQSHVSPNFKCILVMDEKELTLADASLLNRFEKQKMLINDVLNTRQVSLVEKLGDWARRMSTLTGVDQISELHKNEFTQKDLFIGFNTNETLQSLIIDSTKNNPKVTDEEILIKCKERLIAIATSDGIVRAEQSMLEPDEIERVKEIYFQRKRDNLYEYFDDLL
ncbi:8657_t:CDS:2, partial [Funneliformis geosporum]